MIILINSNCRSVTHLYYFVILIKESLVVQFVAESRFANREFANLFFDLDELQF